MNSLQSIPKQERPRERCLKNGPHCLSLRECLAIMIGKGIRGKDCLMIAQEIISTFGTGLSEEQQSEAFFKAWEASPMILTQRLGIGSATATRIITALEIGRRYSSYRERSRYQSQSTTSWKEIQKKTLKKISPHLREDPKEWLGFIPIAPSQHVGELCIVERGVRTHVNLDPIELFARILALRPSAIVLCHNHPSGRLPPSSQDQKLTQKVKEIADELGITVLGHWIVSSQGEYWFT